MSNDEGELEAMRGVAQAIEAVNSASHALRMSLMRLEGAVAVLSIEDRERAAPGVSEAARRAEEIAECLVLLAGRR